MESNRFIERVLFFNRKVLGVIPSPIKNFIKSRVPYAEYRSEQLRREAEQRLSGPIPDESDYCSPYDVLIGIFSDSSFTYTYNIAACRELKVHFKVIDIMASDWLPRITVSGCQAFMATPDTLLNIWHRAYEERLWVLTNDLKMPICPSFNELYLWESKRRMRDWLNAHNIPHPRTWVFFDRSEALKFCDEANYPLVCKIDSGAASSGIFLLRDRQSAKQIVRDAFGRGILARSADSRQREYGTILLQEYVPHEFEWRIVRIGDSYMCRKKVRAGDYASGSGVIGWASPLPGMLDFVKKVTDTGCFTNMTVDLFENPFSKSGPKFLVNELQAIVGFRDVPETNHTGRWFVTPDNASWRFDHGNFHSNACANLRVKNLLQKLNIQLNTTESIK